MRPPAANLNLAMALLSCSFCRYFTFSAALTHLFAQARCSFIPANYFKLTITRCWSDISRISEVLDHWW